MLTAKGHNVTASAPVVAAAAAAEAKVFWAANGTPAATATATAVTVKGATNTSAYVYCLVEKNGTAVVTATTTRRLSNATNASNATANATANTTAASTAVVDKWAAEKAYTASEWAAKYNAMRALTASTAFSFELSTTSVVASHTYKWACMATSLNPVFS